MKSFVRTSIHPFFTFLVFMLLVMFAHAQEESSPLVKAIRSNNLAQVKTLVAGGADVNEIVDYFSSPVEIAIKGGNLTIVKFLVDAGAEDRSGVSEAVRAGNMPMTQYLIEKGFYIGEAIVYAVEANNLPMVKFLAEKGAEVNFSQKRKTGFFKKEYVSPIGEAMSLNNLEIVNVLINYGLPKKDALTAGLNYGKTDIVLALSKDFEDNDWLLLEAFSRDNDAVVSALLSQGVLPNVKDEEGNTLLLMSASKGDLEKAKKCVEMYKLSVHEKNSLGETPLMKAADAGSVALCDYLLQNGVSLTAQNNNGETALFYALNDHSRAAFDFLVKQGADINHISDTGNSLLIKTAMQNQPQMVDYLISLGANIHLKNKDDKTAFFYIVSEASPFTANESLQNTFIAAGADINTQGSNGESLLYKAVERNEFERIRFLIEKGANANTKNHKGERPSCKKSEIIRYLIEHGADINGRDDWNNTFLCDAIDANDLELAYYLVDHRIDVNLYCYFTEQALIKAVKDENITLVTFLAENGADVNAIGYFDQNVMDYAQKGKNQVIIDYLRSRGAMTKEERNAQYKRAMQVESDIKSALIAEDLDRIVAIMAQHEVIILQAKTVQDIAYVAAKKAHMPMINKLLSTDVDFQVNTEVNEAKQTLLFIATIYGHNDLILDLLAKGAKSEMRDTSNKRAADYATKKSTKKIYKQWESNR